MGVQGRGAGSQALGDSAGPRLDRQQCSCRRSPLKHHPGRQRCPGLSYSCLVSSEEDLGSQLPSKQERDRATRQGLPGPGLPVADLTVGVVPTAGTPTATAVVCAGETAEPGRVCLHQARRTGSVVSSWAALAFPAFAKDAFRAARRKPGQREPQGTAAFRGSPSCR